MRPSWSLRAVAGVAGAFMASAALALPADKLAQADPAPAQQRQRAPGVPLAPNPAEANRGQNFRPQGDASPRTDPAEQARHNASPEPDRDPPMPRPVPSIIQN